MSRSPAKRAVLIAGPTASGKSALALQLAREQGAVIVNTDSMQIYDVLQVVTARPGQSEMAEVPHRLFGTVSPAARFSTGDWAKAVAALLPELAGQTVIFVGGTGLYFAALTNGFAEVPPIPAEAVRAAEAEIAGMDREERGQLIAARDPAIAARLKAPDPQRVVRALAVLAATGRSLAAFQDDMQAPLLAGHELEKIVLNPSVEVLRGRIAARFGEMFENGAVDEVKILLAMRLDPALPAMKAIGVPEISAWLEGKIGPEQAIAHAVTATQKYAKRQRTWFRGRMAEWRWVDTAGLDQSAPVL